MICVDRPRLGEPCDDATPECLGHRAGVICEDGVCARALPDGSPCFNPFDCLSGICAGGRCQPERACY